MNEIVFLNCTMIKENVIKQRRQRQRQRTRACTTMNKQGHYANIGQSIFGTLSLKSGQKFIHKIPCSHECKCFSLDVNVCVCMFQWLGMLLMLPLPLPLWMCEWNFFFCAERKRMIYDVNNALHTNRHRIRGCYFAPLTPMNFPARNEFHCAFVENAFIWVGKPFNEWRNEHTGRTHTHKPRISTDIYLMSEFVCVCTTKTVGNVTTRGS